MSRAVSIHIGVNRAPGRASGTPLQYSECLAWRMAGLAEQAGYNSLRVLRGAAATRSAVHDALTWAAGSLADGDRLLVSFSGHGAQERDVDGDEGRRGGWDEGWYLSDGVLLDDRLAAYWRLFERGVRIVVVAECCYGAGSMRGDEDVVCAAPPVPGVAGAAPPGYDGAAGQPAPAADYTRSCIAECPHDTDGIQASLLLLAACGEDQTARESLFARHLLDVWNDGTFRGSYCDLHHQVRERVMMEHGCQAPQIRMLGARDPAFPLERAFHLERRAAHASTAYR